MRISPETMNLLRSLGDTEALKLGENRAFFYDKRRGGRIWPVMTGNKGPTPTGPTKIGKETHSAYGEYEGYCYE